MHMMCRSWLQYTTNAAYLHYSGFSSRDNHCLEVGTSPLIGNCGTALTGGRFPVTNAEVAGLPCTLLYRHARISSFFAESQRSTNGGAPS